MMDSNKANQSIACTVKHCENHCATSDYCSLSSIRIGTHETGPTTKQCTDCLSFSMKSMMR